MRALYWSTSNLTYLGGQIKAKLDPIEITEVRGITLNLGNKVSKGVRYKNLGMRREKNRSRREKNRSRQDERRIEIDERSITTHVNQ